MWEYALGLSLPYTWGAKVSKGGGLIIYLSSDLLKRGTTCEQDRFTLDSVALVVLLSSGTRTICAKMTGVGRNRWRGKGNR